MHLPGSTVQVYEQLNTVNESALQRILFCIRKLVVVIIFSEKCGHNCVRWFEEDSSRAKLRDCKHAAALSLAWWKNDVFNKISAFEW